MLFASISCVEDFSKKERQWKQNSLLLLSLIVTCSLIVTYLELI